MKNWFISYHWALTFFTEIFLHFCIISLPFSSLIFKQLFLAVSRAGALWVDSGSFWLNTLWKAKQLVSWKRETLRHFFFYHISRVLHYVSICLSMLMKNWWLLKWYLCLMHLFAHSHSVHIYWIFAVSNLHQLLKY